MKCRRTGRNRDEFSVRAVDDVMDNTSQVRKDLFMQMKLINVSCMSEASLEDMCMQISVSERFLELRNLKSRIWQIARNLD